MEVAYLSQSCIHALLAKLCWLAEFYSVMSKSKARPTVEPSRTLGGAFSTGEEELTMKGSTDGSLKDAACCPKTYLQVQGARNSANSPCSTRSVADTYAVLLTT